MVDERKEGLKNGLRQLTFEQLKRVRDFNGEMCLDEVNYKNGCFCPLAIGLELNKAFKSIPTQESVYAVLALMGYSINNTRGLPGEFYTTDRLKDLRIALKEVIEERYDERSEN